MVRPILFHSGKPGFWIFSSTRDSFLGMASPLGSSWSHLDKTHTPEYGLHPHLPHVRLVSHGTFGLQYPAIGMARSTECSNANSPTRMALVKLGQIFGFNSSGTHLRGISIPSYTLVDLLHEIEWSSFG